MIRDILARSNREVLERHAGSRTLLAFDFDGTLAPIVADPDRAAMRPSTRRLLRELARECPCVVISGRSRADVVRRLHGMKLAGVVGNHGLEPSRAAVGARRTVRGWLPRLQERLGGIQGVVIEDKGLSLAVHYRRARNKGQARARILAAAAPLGKARLMGGKLVLNILPAGAPHKGVALERERTRLGCDTAVYVGDDETDEDVFALDRPRQLLAIRVGRARSSSAAYYVRTQAEIDGLLRSLLTLGPGPTARRNARARR